MEDKMFEFMEKMYSDLTKKLDSMNNRLDSMDNRLDSMDNKFSTRLDNLENIVTRIEHDHGNKLESLFDGYNQVYEKQQEQDKKFDNLDYKIDDISMRMSRQESKFEVLEGGKKKIL